MAWHPTSAHLTIATRRHTISPSRVTAEQGARQAEHYAYEHCHSDGLRYLHFIPPESMLLVFPQVRNVKASSWIRFGSD